MTFKGFGSLFAQLVAPGSFGPNWWPANFSARCLATQVPRAAPSKRGIDGSIYKVCNEVTCMGCGECSYARDVTKVAIQCADWDAHLQKACFGINISIIGGSSES